MTFLVDLFYETRYICKSRHWNIITTFIEAWCGATVYSYFTAHAKEIIVRRMDVRRVLVNIIRVLRNRERERERKREIHVELEETLM